MYPGSNCSSLAVRMRFPYKKQKSCTSIVTWRQQLFDGFDLGSNTGLSRPHPLFPRHDYLRERRRKSVVEGHRYDEKGEGRLFKAYVRVGRAGTSRGWTVKFWREAGFPVFCDMMLFPLGIYARQMASFQQWHSLLQVAVVIGEEWIAKEKRTNRLWLLLCPAGSNAAAAWSMSRCHDDAALDHTWCVLKSVPWYHYCIIGERWATRAISLGCTEWGK